MADPASSKSKLAGKVAIVSGGASGIGEATARLFAKHGARMVVIADIQDQLGLQVAASIGPQNCTYFHCDVTKEDEVKALVESTVRDHGRLDIMFSNAGILNKSEQTVLDLDLSAFDRLFSINVRGMAACVKHAARAMVEKRVRGSIVCTASVGASRGVKRRTDYCMSKHAVIGLVRSASMQLGGHGIRVNSVSPNVVATPMMCAARGMSVEEVEKLCEGQMCMKEVRLRAGNVADAVVFLASDESELITGHDLVVDGGFSGWKFGADETEALIGKKVQVQQVEG